MEFGLFNLGPIRDRNKSVEALVAETTDQVRLAEQIGFTTAWFAEHHLSNCSAARRASRAAACARSPRRCR